MEELLIIGACAGLLASLLPSGRIGCGLLWLIPVVMIVLVFIEQSDPARKPDALDLVAYVFAPLFPSVGALGGFAVGRAVRRMVTARRR